MCLVAQASVEPFASRHVAICIVGMFFRGATLEDDLRLHFPGKNVTFHAFVASSQQQYETAPNEEVHSAALCGNLLRKGFATCNVHLEAYDGDRFLEASKGLDDFQMINGQVSLVRLLMNC